MYLLYHIPTRNTTYKNLYAARASPAVENIPALNVPTPAAQSGRATKSDITPGPSVPIVWAKRDFPTDGSERTRKRL